MFCLLLTGCVQNAFVRGKVTDISGEELPGVVVRVMGTEHEGLSNAKGSYSFRSSSGTLEIEFCKTGYAPAHRTISVPSLGIFDMEPVQLWPVPAGEGVYSFRQNRYYQTDHPRANRYSVQGAGFAFGTPVDPMLIIPYVNADENPDQNPPTLIAHKMPAYDARLHKLRRVKAILAQSGTVVRNDITKKENQYTENVWIAEQSIPLIVKPLDEPERVLMALRSAQPLEPGVYAIHWGALDGFDSIEARVFIFEVKKELQDSEEKIEGKAENKKRP